MTDMDNKEKDRNVARAFKEEELKVHISLNNGMFLNGIITRVFEEFLVIDDNVHGATNVFFFQLNKPIEEFMEVGG